LDIARETLSVIGLCHNYNTWIYNIIRPYLGQQILEVGCGIGNLTEYFRENRMLTAIDKELRYIEFMKLEFPDVGMYQCDIVTPQILRNKEGTFDSVVCINVLEHIEEDEKALSNMYSLLKKSGNIILMVPAHQYLYGSLDENVGHLRRYNKKTLVDKVKEAGFKIKESYYFNRLGVSGWFVNGRIRKRRQISFIQLLIFDRMVFLIKRIDSWLNLPFGISLFVIGEK